MRATASGAFRASPAARWRRASSAALKMRSRSSSHGVRRSGHGRGRNAWIDDDAANVRLHSRAPHGGERRPWSERVTNEPITPPTGAPDEAASTEGMWRAILPAPTRALLRTRAWLKHIRHAALQDAQRSFGFRPAADAPDPPGPLGEESASTAAFAFVSSRSITAAPRSKRASCSPTCAARRRSRSG
jgi:hypothetical protein